MRTSFILIFSILLFLTAKSQQPTFQWAKSFSGTNYESCQANVTDALGNIYSIGSIYGTTDIDPGPSIYNLTSIGSYDIYISKLNAQGNFIWAKQIGVYLVM